MFFGIFKTVVICGYRMSDASNEAESGDEDDFESFPFAPPPNISIEVFKASPFDKVIQEAMNTWGRISVTTRGVNSETSDTTGSSFYTFRANRRRRAAQRATRESRWVAFSMLLQPRLGEQSLWKLSEEVTRNILEKTLKRQK